MWANGIWRWRRIRRTTTSILFGQAGPCESGPLCATAEALAAQRHSLGDPALDRGERARETVKARSQPPHQSAHRGRLPAQPHRAGGPDAYPRADQAQAWKKASQRQRRANRHASNGRLLSCRAIIAYKALLAGSMAVKVDAYHTSQACPRCGYTSEDNRPGKGLLFVCQACQLKLHADL